MAQQRRLATAVSSIHSVRTTQQQQQRRLITIRLALWPPLNSVYIVTIKCTITRRSTRPSWRIILRRGGPQLRQPAPPPSPTPTIIRQRPRPVFRLARLLSQPLPPPPTISSNSTPPPLLSHDLVRLFSCHHRPPAPSAPVQS